MGNRVNIEELKELLDQAAAAPLPPAIAQRLQLARQSALAHQRRPHAWLARLQHLLRPHDHESHRTLHWVGALLLLAAVLAGGWQWKQVALHDHAALDLAILTDDLPVRMYVE
jgi:hypothetical protein